MLRPPLMHSNTRLPLFLWLKEWQMCKSFPLSSVFGTSRLNEELPVLTSVSGAPWILETRSQPFIMCCWNSNVSRNRAPTSKRIFVLHPHDLPHFSIWDGGLHHLTSSKQLKARHLLSTYIKHKDAAAKHSSDTSCDIRWDACLMLMSWGLGKV